MNPVDFYALDHQQELISFTQELVQIKSFSGQEEKIIRTIENKMKSLGYDEVRIDAMGNLLGRIGRGDKSILFDSHIDTVDVNDEKDWDYPPFSGEIIDGRLYGRGSVDMKSGAAASIFAGAWINQSDLAKDKSIYVSCTVFEEDCDGENLKHLFNEHYLRPGNVIICEPSRNKITLGHKGKAQISIKTHGISAHGSAPEKGVNAIYEMAEIIQRAEKANLELMQSGKTTGTLVMSRITSTGVSLNAVPSECEVYIDRRMIPGETKADIHAQMDSLISGKRATWEVEKLTRKSWTGMEIFYEPFHLAWKIEADHPLTLACVSAHKAVFGAETPDFDYWDFSTNAVTPVSMGIPTIGFGPGDYKLAHMRNENCEVSQIIDACRFYMELIRHI